MSDPIAVPIASGRDAQSGCSGPSSAQDSPANVSPLRRPIYLTADRLGHLEAGLTELDRSVLTFVSELRLVTSAQLMRQFWALRERDPNAARLGRAVLRRLVTREVLMRLPRLVGGVRAGSDGYVYGVGRAGRRLLARHGLQLRRLETPGDRYVAHTLAIAEVVVGLHEAHRAGLLEVIELQTEPRCHRSYLAGLGGTVTLKPDLYLRLGVGAYEDRWFVEVDRGTEAAGTIKNKAAAYLQHYRAGVEQSEGGVYPAVLWVTPTERRADQLREILGRQRAAVEGMHQVGCERELVAQLAAEVRS